MQKSLATPPFSASSSSYCITRLRAARDAAPCLPPLLAQHAKFQPSSSNLTRIRVLPRCARRYASFTCTSFHFPMRPPAFLPATNQSSQRITSRENLAQQLTRISSSCQAASNVLEDRRLKKSGVPYSTSSPSSSPCLNFPFVQPGQ